MPIVYCDPIIRGPVEAVEQQRQLQAHVERAMRPAPAPPAQPLESIRRERQRIADLKRDHAAHFARRRAQTLPLR